MATVEDAFNAHVGNALICNEQARERIVSGSGLAADAPLLAHMHAWWGRLTSEQHQELKDRVFMPSFLAGVEGQTGVLDMNEMNRILPDPPRIANGARNLADRAHG